MDSSIVLRINKLLALSESSNEHEAKASMLKAQELLVKHKLSMSEIKEFQDQKINVIENKTNITFTKAKWKGQLAYIIAENFGCYTYFRTYKTQTIVFMGKDEDVIVCTIVLEYAIDCINKEVKKLRYKYLKDGYSTKGLESDYAFGFIQGLNSSFEKQKQDNQEWGLVLVKDRAVKEEYNNKKFHGAINLNASFKGFGNAYYQGVEDGEKFSISDRIAGEGVE